MEEGKREREMRKSEVPRGTRQALTEIHVPWGRATNRQSAPPIDLMLDLVLREQMYGVMQYAVINRRQYARVGHATNPRT